MATSDKSPRVRSKRARRAAASAGKVRKEFWLDPTALAEAQALLGTETERETVEVALELVAFRRDLAKGAKALAGLPLSRLD
jgi:Arc/MetJ family transcription regulator